MNKWIINKYRLYIIHMHIFNVTLKVRRKIKGKKHYVLKNTKTNSSDTQFNFSFFLFVCMYVFSVCVANGNCASFIDYYYYYYYDYHNAK